MSQITESDVKTEVGEWIDQNWDPELTVAQWWQLMADARLSHTMLSEEAGEEVGAEPSIMLHSALWRIKGFWDHRQGSV